MRPMAEAKRSIFDRILRTEGAISFIQQINNIVGYALGGGVLTTAITWLQGALSQYGFAAYVIVFLVVSILIIVLMRLIADFRQRSGLKRADSQDSTKRPDIPEKIVTLDDAAHVLTSLHRVIDVKSGVDRIVQKASDDELDVWASQIHSFGSDIKYCEYGPSHKLDPTLLRAMKISKMKEDKIDVERYGKYILRDEGADKSYGKIQVDLSRVVYY